MDYKFNQFELEYDSDKVDSDCRKKFWIIERWRNSVGIRRRSCDVQKINKKFGRDNGKKYFFLTRKLSTARQNKLRYHKTNISNAICFPTLEEALKKFSDAWIIGGAQLYEYALQRDLVDAAVITQVKRSYEADKFLNPEHLQKFERELIIEKENFCIWKLTRSSKTNLVIDNRISKAHKKLTNS